MPVIGPNGLCVMLDASVVTVPPLLGLVVTVVR